MPAHHEKRLDSWKDIAVHLGRDVSTVIRWERERGLPVHRVPGGKRHAVFAYADEIEAWLAGTKPIELSPASPASAPLGLLARIPRLVQAGLIAALAIGIFAVASFVWKATTAAPLASVVLRDNKFEARDKSGRVLWTYPLPQGSPEVPPDRTPAIAHMGDIGTGNRIVMLGVPYAAGNRGDDAVYCFSERGKLLWRFQPVDHFTFGSGEYGPPWIVFASAILRGPGNPKIALVANHLNWWPSVVTVLDRQGQPVGRFVDSGQTYVLASMDTASGPRLLAGGVRNQETEVSGKLAILDANHPSGSSPEVPGSNFECTTCPTGRPTKYFVFPRSELNILTRATFNKVESIQTAGETIQVLTAEAEARDLGAVGMFEFTSDLQLKSARWSDGYRQIHKLLESEGKIRHRWEQCPDRFGPRLVRSWDPEHGWIELHPNPAAK